MECCSRTCESTRLSLFVPPARFSERVDLGAHNVHLWSDQAWTVEETGQPDENSDHKAEMLWNTEEINSVRDVGWHFDRIPNNGTIACVRRLEDILYYALSDVYSPPLCQPSLTPNPNSAFSQP